MGKVEKTGKSYIRQLSIKTDEIQNTKKTNYICCINIKHLTSENILRI